MTPSQNQQPDPQFITAISGHPLLAQILWRRGLRTVQSAQAFLNPQLYSPASPFELPDLDKAVHRLHQAIAHGEHIQIWGDFDVDGQSATSVLLLALRKLGAKVDYSIPNRHTHSHGLNEDGLRQAQQAGARVLLTCDCAVTDFEQIAFAQTLGMDVIITDHHDLGPKLPDALAVVNPKRLPPTHPLANLPGVGVAFKLAQALLYPHASGAPEAVDETHCADEFLDLVALGIVADLAEQRNDTRYLLQMGLRRLRMQARPGVRALMTIAAVAPESADAESISFQLAPRLNAAGRLDSANLSVELLTCNDFEQALKLAGHIDTLNLSRKDLQRTTLDEALAKLQAEPALIEAPIIVISQPNWNLAVLGLVAAGLVDRYAKPAIVISAPEGALARGSARSVAGIDIHALIQTQKPLLEQGGGHPMAAGMVIQQAHIAAFREGINHEARHQPANRHPTNEDEHYEIQLRDINMDLVDALEPLAPFGAGNPRPCFKVRGARVARMELFGHDRRHLALHLRDARGDTLRAVRWNNDIKVPTAAYAAVDVIFTVQRNIFAGKVEPRAFIKDIREAATQDAPAAESAAALTARYRIHDLRGNPDAQALLKQLVSAWRSEQINTVGSWLDMQAQPLLVIAQALPGPNELRTMLQSAQPGEVILLDDAPLSTDNFDEFLRAIAGMIKVADLRGDSLDDRAVLARMAAKIHHRPETVQEAIRWLRENHNRQTLINLFEESLAFKHFMRSAPAADVLHV